MRIEVIQTPNGTKKWYWLSPHGDTIHLGLDDSYPQFFNGKEILAACELAERVWNKAKEETSTPYR